MFLVNYIKKIPKNVFQIFSKNDQNLIFRLSIFLLILLKDILYIVNILFILTL